MNGITGYAHGAATTDTHGGAYIAGLIDGEGTVTLTRKHRNENRQLSISISNTERMLLEYVHRTVAAGKITRNRTTKACHTPSYTYAIYNRQALSLLIQIQPYLQTYKARRAELIIRDYIALTPYLPASRCDRLLFISGQFPLENGRLK